SVGAEPGDAWPVSRDQQGQQREGRDGATDVGDVDGEEPALADVTEPEREGQDGHNGEHEGGGGDKQLLEQRGDEAVATGPAVGVEEVLPGLDEEVHQRVPAV